VVLLATGLVALIPAELFLESGLVARSNCAPTAVAVADGVCASPWQGSVGVATSMAALLAARLDWVDDDWTVVPEGASKAMVAAEVRTGDVGGRRVLATDCTLTATPCEAVAGTCGSIEYVRGGAFGFKATRSSLQSTPAPPSPPAPRKPPLGSVDPAVVPTPTPGPGQAVFGDIVFQGAFVVFDDPPAAAAAAAAAAARARSGGGEDAPPGRYYIAVRGVEVALGGAEGDRIFAAYRSGSTAPLTIAAGPPLQARSYAITCATDGLTARDLAQALAVYRRMQFSTPGTLTYIPDNSVVRPLPGALTRNDVLRAAFSFKAEDVRSVCGGPTLVYAGCGAMEWWRAAPLGAMAVLLVAVWAAAVAAAARLPRTVDVPTDATAWRRQALDGLGDGGGGGAASYGGGAAAGDGEGLQGGKRSPTASWGPSLGDGGGTPGCRGSTFRRPAGSVSGGEEAAADVPPMNGSRGRSPRRLGAGPAPRATSRGTVYWVVDGS